jgi:hypothetical protein
LEAQPIALPQFVGLRSPDVHFATLDIQIRVLSKESKTNGQVGCGGGRQLEIEHQATQGDQQMQLVGKDGLGFWKAL